MIFMAYASKYYDPVKAHEYYMRTRKLKGYENRYGGSRGNGTSAASGGTVQKSASSNGSSNVPQSFRARTSSTVSTSGLNQKGKEAAAYIKSQMEKEREELTKKTNKEIDRQMLADVKKLQADIAAMRSSGRGFSRQQLLNRISVLAQRAKTTKSKTLAKHKEEYVKKYRDEIEKLRTDSSMYSYSDTKRKKRSRKGSSSVSQYSQPASSRLVRYSPNTKSASVYGTIG